MLEYNENLNCINNKRGGAPLSAKEYGILNRRRRAFTKNHWRSTFNVVIQNGQKRPLMTLNFSFGDEKTLMARNWLTNNCCVNSGWSFLINAQSQLAINLTQLVFIKSLGNQHYPFIRNDGPLLEVKISSKSSYAWPYPILVGFVYSTDEKKIKPGNLRRMLFWTECPNIPERLSVNSKLYQNKKLK